MPKAVVIASCWSRRLRRSAQRWAAGVTCLRLFQTRVVVPVGWMLGAPLLLWLIAARYVPLLAPSLGEGAAWTVALASLALINASLLGQVAAHLGMARLLRQPCPARLSVYPFGDAANAWSLLVPPGRAALIAGAGPVWHMLVGGVAYAVWRLHLHPIVDLTALLLALVNLGLALLNLAPGFPLDGGHLTRAIVSRLLRAPASATPIAQGLGWGQIIGLLLWGCFLRSYDVPFAAGCSWLSLGCGGLLGWAVSRHPVSLGRALLLWPPRVGVARRLIATGLVLSLLASAASLLPLPYGVRMPGAATPIEPMIDVPAGYRHATSGSFLLTTIVDHTPIVVGQWLYAQVDPVVDVLPPERVIPPDVAPQRYMRHHYRLLVASEETARQVALGRAGLTGTDVVVEIRPFNIIGGPSAGLMFALATYDLMTPDDLTRGWQIAGTGTLDRDGRVGPVAGVKQKVAAAEAAQADYFLVPLENYAVAAAAARRLQVIPVTSFEEAIEALQRLPMRYEG